MKKTALLTTLLTSILFISCSSDESGTGSNFETPLTIGNYWTYDVEGQAGITRDSLYISNDTVIGSNTYKKFKTENDITTGFYSSALRNNGVRVSDDKLKLSGDLSLASGQTLPIAVDLTLSDFVIFNKNASNNQALNSSPKTGTIQQTVSGYPLNINYSLQSYGGETLASFTSPNGDVYTDVKTTKIKLNVEITTTISGFPITALASQDVLVSTQYLADGIGVVYTNTVTSYSLNSLVATQLGVPATNSQTQEEFLDTYLVN
ncbi:MAG TPA: hypothetical protein VK164_01790 [Flavobacterium sp.]|uniref:hypothetical protein n=1 Tax=Flavobacterium sp. TaxID=239 RepID=UPI002B4B7A56|nr:hypothetical protein [Flavobacterium sp.]HLO72643.1 hypothetical protein [Flavobacterium sp.]